MTHRLSTLRGDRWATGRASSRRWIVHRRLPAHDWNVILCGILLYHAPGREPLPGHAQGLLHPFHPAERHAALVTGIEQRHHLLLQHLVEPLRIGLVGFLTVRHGRDRPAVLALEPL